MFVEQVVVDTKLNATIVNVAKFVSDFKQRQTEWVAGGAIQPRCRPKQWVIRLQSARGCNKSIPDQHREWGEGGSGGGGGGVFWGASSIVSFFLTWISFPIKVVCPYVLAQQRMFTSCMNRKVKINES
jgi:hypothetical protein